MDMLYQEKRDNRTLEFTKREYEYFIENCGFTKDEIEVLNMRRNGDSIMEITLELNKSKSTIDRIIKKIKRKIMKVL